MFATLCKINLKAAEDDTYLRGLLLLDLETMESKVISNGTNSDAISASGWLNNDRIWYAPRYKRGQGTKGRVVFAVDLDGTKRKLIRQYQSWTDRFEIYNFDLSDPEHVYEMNNQRRAFVYDYFKLNVYTGKKTLIARGPDMRDMKGIATLRNIYVSRWNSNGHPFRRRNRKSNV